MSPVRGRGGSGSVGVGECQEGGGFHSQEAGEGKGIGGAQDRSVGQTAHRCQGCSGGRGRGGGGLGEAHVEMINRGWHGGGLGSGFGGL